MTLSNRIVSLLAGLIGISLLVPVFALAQTGLGSDQIRPNATASSTISQARMDKAKEKAQQEIDRRISALNALNTRVGAMTKISTEFKQNLNTDVQSQISTFTALKAKIAADTELDTLKSDIRSIAVSYRIFMLVIPQGHIAAAADREVTIINILAGIGAKLEARLQAAQTAGADITALSATLSDMAAKVTSAQTHAQAAVTGSATLTPDNGDKTKMASNEAALKAARKEIQAAQQDLVAARKDAETIIKALRTLNVGTSASTTTQTP